MHRLLLILTAIVLSMAITMLSSRYPETQPVPSAHASFNTTQVDDDVRLASYGTWVQMQGDEYVSPKSVKTQDHYVKASIRYSDTYSKLMGSLIVRVLGDDGTYVECEKLTKGAVPSTLTVNGKLVDFVFDCTTIDQGVRLNPVTNYTNKYLIQELSDKDYIQIDQAKITTNGFIRSYAELIIYSNIINPNQGL